MTLNLDDKHVLSARALRTMVEECGNVFDVDALDYILDELRASQKEVRTLTIQLQTLRSEIGSMVRERERRNLEAVRKAAERVR